MNFIRTSGLWRGQPQEHQIPDIEQQRPANVEGQTQNGSRFRPAMPALFTRWSGLGAQGRRPNEVESEDEGLKSPLHRFHLPSLARSRTQNTSNQPPSEDGIQESESSSQPLTTRTRTQRFPVLARPPAVRTEESGRQASRRSRFEGSDPAELHLVDVAESGRWRQRRAQRRANLEGSLGRRKKEPPKRFLFCFPWVKSRRARVLILRCFVSGAFLISMLTICMLRLHHDTWKMSFY
jgi:hypothetical protein